MEKATAPRRKSSSPSPSPPPEAIPTIFDSAQKMKPEEDGRENQLQDKFKKFWMAAVVDAFQNDLEHLRTVGGFLASSLPF